MLTLTVRVLMKTPVEAVEVKKRAGHRSAGPIVVLLQNLGQRNIVRIQLRRTEIKSIDADWPYAMNKWIHAREQAGQANRSIARDRDHLRENRPAPADFVKGRSDYSPPGAVACVQPEAVDQKEQYIHWRAN
jgi:hypothetical protein